MFGIGVAVGDGLGVGLGVGDGLAVGDGLGVGVATATVEGLAGAVPPQAATSTATTRAASGRVTDTGDSRGRDAAGRIPATGPHQTSPEGTGHDR
jgi:hypothetical protein